MRRILAWSAATLVLLIAAAAALLTLVDPVRLRPAIETGISAMMDRTVTIAGDLDLELSLAPTLTANEVTIANIPGGTRENMASVGRLKVQMRLLPLLTGAVMIDQFMIEDGDILLEIGAGGVGNWVFESNAGVQDEIEPWSEDFSEFISHLELRNTTLAFTGRTGLLRRLDISQAVMKADAQNDGFELESHFALDGEAVTGSLSSPSLSALLAGAADWPLTFSFRTEDSRISATGVIKDTMTFVGYRLDMDADISSPAKVARLLALTLPELPAFKVRATADGGPDNVALSGLEAEFGGSQMAGDLVFTLVGERPGIAGDLTFARLDLNDVLGGTAFDPDGADDDEVIPIEPFGETDIDLRLHIQELALDVYRLSISDVVGSIRLQNGQLQISVDESQFFGGELVADVAMDARELPVSASIDLTAENFDAGALLAFLDISDGLVGHADFEVSLAGSGMSPRSLFGTSNGIIKIDLVSGEVYTELLDDVKGQAPTIILPIGSNENAELLCFVGHFDVVDGIATSTILLVDGQDATIGGTGAIDLGRYEMDFIIRARSKDAAAIDLAIPVRVYGPVDDPDVSIMTDEFMASTAVGLLLGVIIDPLAIVIPYLGTGTGEQNPCLAAVRDGKAPELE